MTDSTEFKICPLCKTAWSSRKDFLEDPQVDLVGYQVHFAELALGYFLFNHTSCGTTMAIVAGAFQDLYQGEPFEQRLTGSDLCPGLCLREDELEPCPAHCECAYVRDILQTIRHWPKCRADI